MSYSRTMLRATSVVKRAARVLRTAYAHGMVDTLIDEEAIHGAQ